MQNKVKVLLSSPGVGVFVKQSALAYNEQQILEKFATTYVGNKNSKLNSILHQIPGLKKQLNLRNIYDLDLSKISTYPYKELIRTFSSKMFNEKITDKVWEWAELSFDNWVASNFVKGVDIVHCYEHASLSTLVKSNKLGVFSVYEQPSVHHAFFRNQIAEPLLKEHSYFRSEYEHILNSELTTKRNLRKDQELNLSNIVLCNSSFVRDSIIKAGIDEGKIITIPLGSPTVKDIEIKNSDTLTFIVAGNLSYLKGVHQVLQVWKANHDIFKDHKLILVGSNFLSDSEYEGLPENVQIYKRLPSSDFHRMLRDADVLISNTYSDGFGMVITEAMAHGLCVIATNNCIAPDIIKNEVNGLLIDAGNKLMLFDRMKWCIENQGALSNIKKNAYATSENYTWENYRKKLVETVLNKYHLEKSTTSNK